MRIVWRRRHSPESVWTADAPSRAIRPAVGLAPIAILPEGLAARDAVSALTNLGYAHGEAAAAVSAAIGKAGREARTEELIRLGLRELAQ